MMKTRRDEMNHEMFLNHIHNDGDIYQNKLTQSYRKNNGIYYTHVALATQIISDLLSDTTIKNIHKKTFFEPAVGSGNFVFAYLAYVSQNYSLNKEEVLELYRNIYVCDFDKKVIELYISNLFKSSKQLFNVQLPSSFKPNTGGALVFNLELKSSVYFTPSSYFNIDKFDFIVTNPPYKNLRAERRHYASISEYEKTANFYSEIKEIAKSNFLHSNNHSANIFKYFTEEILIHYSKPDSKIALLIPSSILTDKSCASLRRYIIDNANLKKIVSFPETTKYIDANQSITYLIIDMDGKTKQTKIANVVDDKNISNINYIKIPVHELVNKDTNDSILMLNEVEYSLLNKLNSFPKLKDLDFIVNNRGELDLTLNKQSITNKKTKYILLKGRNIGYYQLNPSDRPEFVNEEFVKNSPKKEYIMQTRLACQQIVNLNKEQRLMFALVPPLYVLGNSCNFIYVKENEYCINLFYLQGLLNSKLMNWYFKLYSSNNHVNNYELDNLPIPLVSKKIISKISSLVKSNNNNNHSNLVTNEIENLIEICFGIKVDPLNYNEANKSDMSTVIIDKLVSKSLKEKNELINSKKILNDFQYKLSELDLEIIKAVPQGGSWKDIPQNIMNKSKRLLGIQKTGGRTTLYGRLEYDKPSYTITTYFNRPGNGCNIHPIENRVLSTREAARLQGFPDDFYFVGNQRDILNQIGNAVPPQIGYLIGKKIKEKLGISTSVDLFSGAGGFLLGMKYAGINHVVANDFDKSACITLKTNNPEIDVIFDDITNKNVKEKIIIKGKDQGANIVCGGPPCQGFSMAGFRNPIDPRNKLFYEFVQIINGIKPKAFVFENVTGLLSHNKGKTFEDIKTLFSMQGYNLTADTLNFEEYGIPQRRKRVIIIGVRDDLDIEPKELLPTKITIKQENQITVREAIFDLQNVYSDYKSYSKLYLNLIQSKISFDEYNARLKDLNTI